jgi:uncharacterized protein with PQ loop repeat
MQSCIKIIKINIWKTKTDGRITLSMIVMEATPAFPAKFLEVAWLCQTMKVTTNKDTAE